MLRALRQSHAVGSGILGTEYARLVFVIQIIVLDEAEVPCRGIFHHALEHLQAVVEREAHEAYLALRLQPLSPPLRRLRQEVRF